MYMYRIQNAPREMETQWNGNEAVGPLAKFFFM
jgi:hypothetical protein